MRILTEKRYNNLLDTYDDMVAAKHEALRELRDTKTELKLVQDELNRVFGLLNKNANAKQKRDQSGKFTK